MFVPSAYRAACLPRTPPVKSYSARIFRTSDDLAFLDVSFFIIALLSASREARADQPDLATTLGVAYHKESAAPRTAYVHKPRLSG